MLKIIHMKVNDKPVEVAVEPGELLADTLRNRFGLTSVKKGMQRWRMRGMYGSY